MWLLHLHSPSGQDEYRTCWSLLLLGHMVKVHRRWQNERSPQLSVWAREGRSAQAAQKHGILYCSQGLTGRFLAVTDIPAVQNIERKERRSEMK